MFAGINCSTTNKNSGHKISRTKQMHNQFWSKAKTNKIYDDNSTVNNDHDDNVDSKTSKLWPCYYYITQFEYNS